MKLAGWLQSSTDPETVSNTVRGAILAVSGLIIFAAAEIFHVTLSANDIITLATELGTIAGLLWTVYGLVMKIVMWAGTLKQTPQN